MAGHTDPRGVWLRVARADSLRLLHVVWGASLHVRPACGRDSLRLPRSPSLRAQALLASPAPGAGDSERALRPPSPHAPCTSTSHAGTATASQPSTAACAAALMPPPGHAH